MWFMPALINPLHLLNVKGIWLFRTPEFFGMNELSQVVQYLYTLLSAVFLLSNTNWFSWSSFSPMILAVLFLSYKVICFKKCPLNFDFNKSKNIIGHPYSYVFQALVYSVQYSIRTHKCVNRSLFYTVQYCTSWSIPGVACILVHTIGEALKGYPAERMKTMLHFLHQIFTT